MKYRMKILLIISLFFLFPFTINALELCEMSKEYEAWMALSEEEKANSIEPRYCEDDYKKSKVASQLLEIDTFVDIKDNTHVINGSSIDQSRYNSYDYNIVTPARNQKGTNSCWAFASLSAVETSAIMDGLPETALSAKHIEYMVTRNAFTDYNNEYGFDRELDAGGNPYFAGSYFFRHDGPILETSMPYTEHHYMMKTTDLPKDKAYFDIGSYRTEYYEDAAYCNTNQIDTIKKNVIEHGSVVASIYYDTSFLNKNIYYNYNDYSGIKNSNHAVTIVGWDDNISASNFKNATHNGAWIVKNSWGPTWGENGTFYVSYDDIRICGSMTTFFDVRKNTFDNTYFAADTLANVSFPMNGGYVYSKAKFTKKSNKDEYLDKVSVEVNANNNYEVYVSVGTDAEGSWQLVGSGVATINSVVSLRFAPIKITSDFYVIVKYTKGNYPAMCKTLFTDIHDKINISSKTNYYAMNSKTAWHDMSEISEAYVVSGCEPVIYAYTTNAVTGSPTFKIESLTGSREKVYNNTDGYFNMKISSSNINSYEGFTYKIFNSSNSDVTSNFTITDTIANGIVKIYPKANAQAGTYKIKVTYSNQTLESSFTLHQLISSSKYKIQGDYIIVSMDKEKSLAKNTFVSNINFNSNSYKVLSSAKEDITSSTSYIGTGMQLALEGKTFTIVVIGDVSGDGQILSNDTLLIKRHLVYLNRLNDAQILASDVSKDGDVLSNDALIIARFLVGARSSL